MEANKLPKYQVFFAKESAKYYFLSTVLASAVLYSASLFLSYVVLYYLIGILLLTLLLFPVLMGKRPKERVSSDGKAVFISGCDSGFGHMLARRLDNLGFQVFAGCLDPDANGAADLRKSGSRRLHVISLDVTSDMSVQNAAAYVKENIKDNVLWAVVNNAGINSGGQIHWTDFETIKKVLDVNTFGVVRVTQSLLSLLSESKNGRVVAVASAAGRYAYPGMVPYCMSKSAAISFCDGLRLEMFRWGLQVVTIEPWMYKTPIVDKDRIVTNLNETWKRTPKHVKDMYEPNFINWYIKRSLLVPKVLASDNIGEVVDLMEEAVTALYPEYVYYPGTFGSKLVAWIVCRLPKPVADIIMVLMLTRS